MVTHRILAFSSVVLAFAGSAAAADGIVGTRKSLLRFHDPVVLETGRLDPLPDRRSTQLRLYRVEEGALVPIPFQLDARDADGEVTFSRGRAPEDFVLDDNDELVFMAKDTGHRIGTAALPSASDGALEIEMTDPRTGDAGWAYLVHFPGSPPPTSPIVYATFDRAANRAEGLFYTVEYPPAANYYTGMSIRPAAGGSGENLLDRMKVRLGLKFSLLLGGWSPSFTEEDFSVRIVGVKNGPVRAIRRVRTWLNLGRFFPDLPGGTVYTYYYSSSFVTPSQMSFPWLVLKTLRKFHFVGTTDFRDTALGMTYWDAANPNGLRFTGHNQAPVNRDEDHGWWVVGGEGGACLHVFSIPDEWIEWGVVRGSVFADDAAAVDEEGAESEPGVHAAGYDLKNVLKLARAGSYQVNLATIILPAPYRPGDEALPMEMIDHPLHVDVRPVTQQ